MDVCVCVSAYLWVDLVNGLILQLVGSDRSQSQSPAILAFNLQPTLCLINGSNRYRKLISKFISISIF